MLSKVTFPAVILALISGGGVEGKGFGGGVSGASDRKSSLSCASPWVTRSETNPKQGEGLGFRLGFF